jgi:hypothetical protein
MHEPNVVIEGARIDIFSFGGLDTYESAYDSAMDGGRIPLFVAL